MEDSDVLPSPFWLPPATLTQRHRRRASSPLLNSSIMIILLPTFSLLFIVFFVVPSISRILPYANTKPISTNSSPSSSPPIHIHNHNKSNSLKKSWDSLNIILVVFAILCGIFAKRNDNPPSSSSTGSHSQQIQPQASTNSASVSASFLLQRSKSVMHQHQQSSSVPQWFDHYSQPHHHRTVSSPLNTSPTPNMLRRTVSSDPYMRDTGHNQFRFLDDLDASRFYPKEESQPQPQPSESIPQVDGRVKDIPVDTFVLRNREELPSSPQTPPRKPPTPPPPPPPTKERRTFQTIPGRERPQSSDHSPSPLPPSDHRQKRSSRKRTTKDIATAIVSLYSHGKRKRRLKPTRNHAGPQTPQAQSQFTPSPSPPPPPPPLPPSVFHNLFKKTKKIHVMSAIPTPPPPPSRRSIPPLPTRRERGNESPMNGIPTPPLPFKVSEMEFPVVGRVQSAQSQRCESPETDDGKGGTEERVTSSCPSPDVNIKADTFIARHHNGWRLEKLNSWREKHTTTTTTKAADLIGSHSHSHNQFLRIQ